MIVRGNRVATGGEIHLSAIHSENGIITAVTPLDDKQAIPHADQPAYDGIILPGRRTALRGSEWWCRIIPLRPPELKRGDYGQAWDGIASFARQSPSSAAP